MIGLIEKLVGLDVVIHSKFSADILLLSLPALFDEFVVYFTMNKLEDTLEELINMLTTYETTIKKEKLVILLGSSSGTKKGVQNKGKKRSVPPKKNKPNKKPYKKPNLGTTKPYKSEHFCFHYNKPGHLRRNCTKYVAQKCSGHGDGKKQET
ncbi:uncharacterized protein [Primulina huaijiensis]|uniref:uncharacterized protein n=1 Tax=Primulina huaijiensis TaxID=1492673 RepID=UPI003CC77B96